MHAIVIRFYGHNASCVVIFETHDVQSQASHRGLTTMRNLGRNQENLELARFSTNSVDSTHAHGADGLSVARVISNLFMVKHLLMYVGRMLGDM